MEVDDDLDSEKKVASTKKRFSSRCGRSTKSVIYSKSLLSITKMAKKRNNKVQNRWKDGQTGMNSPYLPSRNCRPKWETKAESAR